MGERLRQNVSVEFSSIDFELLVQQKLKLIDLIGNAEADDLWGVVHLIDDIQDQSVEEFGEITVFGYSTLEEE